MPLFHSKFTCKLASTVNLFQRARTNPYDGSDRPIQYTTGETSTRMCREHKLSIASTFINSAFTMANPNVEKSKEFLRKLAKMHPPGKAKSPLKKESIAIVRNPENEEIPYASFCDVDSGSKTLIRFQLDAVHQYHKDKYIHSVETLLPPAPMLSYGRKNHRILRTVASVGSIGSQTSSFKGTSGDSLPIGTPCDSFERQHERTTTQATHSGTPSDRTHGRIKSVHIAKSVPLLNRSVHRSYRPRRVSRDLPSIPIATPQTTHVHGSMERTRAAENANSRPIGGMLHERQETTLHQTSTPTHVHERSQQQKRIACALCQRAVPPNVPAIFNFQCQRCAVRLCPECFETLGTVNEDENENEGSSKSAHTDEVHQTSPNGHTIYAQPLSESRSKPVPSRRSGVRCDSSHRSLVERKKGLQMAQCSDCLRCWCATCSKGDPSRFFQSVVTEIRDDSSEMTVPDGEIFVKQKKVCPGCYIE